MLVYIEYKHKHTFLQWAQLSNTCDSDNVTEAVVVSSLQFDDKQSDISTLKYSTSLEI